MLLAVDLHEDFVDVEGIAISTMAALQPLRVDGPELDAPQADRLPGDDDASLRQEIFYSR